MGRPEPECKFLHIFNTINNYNKKKTGRNFGQTGAVQFLSHFSFKTHLRSVVTRRSRRTTRSSGTIDAICTSLTGVASITLDKKNENISVFSLLISRTTSKLGLEILTLGPDGPGGPASPGTPWTEEARSLWCSMCGFHCFIIKKSNFFLKYICTDQSSGLIPAHQACQSHQWLLGVQEVPEHRLKGVSLTSKVVFLLYFSF